MHASSKVGGGSDHRVSSGSSLGMRRVEIILSTTKSLGSLGGDRNITNAEAGTSQPVR